jgi:hypothetical protein
MNKEFFSLQYLKMFSIGFQPLFSAPDVHILHHISPRMGCCKEQARTGWMDSLDCFVV